MTEIRPRENLIVLPQGTARGVDLSGMNPAIDLVEFSDTLGRGLVHYVNAQPESISSLDAWQTELDQAQEIIYAYENPKVYYVTTPTETLHLGQAVVVNTLGWSQPADTTELAPPAQVILGTKMYWFNENWVWSAFPLPTTLSAAKKYLIAAVSSKAYNLLEPSDWMVTRKSEINVDIPTDWSNWRESVRTEASNKRTEVSTKTNLASLKTYVNSPEYLNWPSAPDF